jgi:hypothetical protein
MTRQLAFLMRASKGAFTHDAILRLTWRQFQVYLDSFTWLLREESEEGRRENRRADVVAMVERPEVKEKHRSGIDRDREKLRAWRERVRKKA